MKKIFSIICLFLGLMFQYISFAGGNPPLTSSHYSSPQIGTIRMEHYPMKRVGEYLEVKFDLLEQHPISEFLNKKSECSVLKTKEIKMPCMIYCVTPEKQQLKIKLFFKILFNQDDSLTLTACDCTVTNHAGRFIFDIIGDNVVNQKTKDLNIHVKETNSLASNPYRIEMTRDLIGFDDLHIQFETKDPMESVVIEHSKNQNILQLQTYEMNQSGLSFVIIFEIINTTKKGNHIARRLRCHSKIVNDQLILTPDEDEELGLRLCLKPMQSAATPVSMIQTECGTELAPVIIPLKSANEAFVPAGFVDLPSFAKTGYVKVSIIRQGRASKETPTEDISIASDLSHLNIKSL